LDAVVPAGATYAFAAEIAAPVAAGDYSMRWQMLQSAEWFGDATPAAMISVVAATPPPPTATTGNGARVISATLPGTLRCGEGFAASVTVENTGSTLWTRGSHRLGAVGDEDPLAPDNRVYLPDGAVVHPGERYTFAIPLRAPRQPGTYGTDWRMV